MRKTLTDLAQYETMYKTVVGSHCWGMARKDSDLDVYRCFIAPSGDFLVGIKHDKGHEEQSDKVDISSYEIVHVINLLKQGNINHIIGLFSQHVRESSTEHMILKSLFMDNLSRNCYKSIRGMAMHNYRRYLCDKPRTHLEPDAYNKKLGQMGRLIKFGIKLLTYHDIEFLPCQPESRYEIEDMLEELDQAYRDSKLPDNVDDDAYNKFLLELRLRRLNL